MGAPFAVSKSAIPVAEVFCTSTPLLERVVFPVAGTAIILLRFVTAIILPPFFTGRALAAGCLGAAVGLASTATAAATVGAAAAATVGAASACA